jgi:hypothetical protein
MVSNIRIRESVVAPFAFLIPISLVQFSEVKEASPNNPIQASKRAMIKASPTSLEIKKVPGLKLIPDFYPLTAKFRRAMRREPQSSYVKFITLRFSALK